ncbi:MAG: hypothetical protein BMS9Abin28_2036 [Anaerolineae bacterium]|nr:MAG: hypothetical protein BMS9Abin28_2036 [Anaerolineae bacterium]
MTKKLLIYPDECVGGCLCEVFCCGAGREIKAITSIDPCE